VPVGIMVYVLRGENRLAAGRLEAAEADFRQAISKGQQVFGALGTRGLARVALERGQVDSAAAGLHRALTVFRRMRPNHIYVLSTKRALAEALAQAGRYAEADSLLGDVLRLQRETLVKGHVELGRVLQALGEVKLRSGDAHGAEPLLREALAIRLAALGPDHWNVAETESVLGAALAAQDRPGDARPLLASGYERLLAQRGISDRRTRDARARLER
jgi:tetratricopeptide (TPR) repeat protein